MMAKKFKFLLLLIPEYPNMTTITDISSFLFLMVKICKYGGAPENSMDTSRDYATLFGDTVYVTAEYFAEEL